MAFWLLTYLRWIEYSLFPYRILFFIGNAKFRNVTSQHAVKSLKLVIKYLYSTKECLVLLEVIENWEWFRRRIQQQLGRKWVHPKRHRRPPSCRYWFLSGTSSRTSWRKRIPRYTIQWVSLWGQSDTSKFPRRFQWARRDISRDFSEIRIKM